MQNINIKPGQLVPPHIRIECYQKAIELIQTHTYISDMISHGSCVGLHCILWGLKTFLDPAPNGSEWYYELIQDMFPEWTPEIVISISLEPLEEDKDQLRIGYYNLAIQQAKLLL